MFALPHSVISSFPMTCKLSPPHFVTPSIAHLHILHRILHSHSPLTHPHILHSHSPLTHLHIIRSHSLAFSTHTPSHSPLTHPYILHSHTLTFSTHTPSHSALTLPHILHLHTLTFSTHTPSHYPPLHSPLTLTLVQSAHPHSSLITYTSSHSPLHLHTPSQYHSSREV